MLPPQKGVTRAPDSRELYRPQKNKLIIKLLLVSDDNTPLPHQDLKAGSGGLKEALRGHFSSINVALIIAAAHAIESLIDSTS